MSTRSIPTVATATVTPITPAVVEVPVTTPVKAIKVPRITKVQARTEQDRRAGLIARTPWPAQHIVEATGPELAAKAGRKAPAKVKVVPVVVAETPVLGFVDTAKVVVTPAVKAAANAAFVAALTNGEGKPAARLAFKAIISA